MKIIGVTGTFASGKDTVAALLQEQGFRHVSLSDCLREELTVQHVPITRDNLFRVSNEVGEREGKGFLADRAMGKIDQQHNWVLTSIRKVEEVERLRSLPNFILVAVDADPELRFTRLMKRTERKENDPKTFEEFIAKEQREMGTDPDASQNLAACMELADTLITNNGPLDEFKQKVEALL